MVLENTGVLGSLNLFIDLLKNTKILVAFVNMRGKIKKRLNRLRKQNLFCCHFCHSNAVCNVLKNN
ncbi:Uncharacterised protein [uncultured Prevotella sp.]|nr:Uncharacterised protein [uncultured Prevotella sp.]